MTENQWKIFSDFKEELRNQVEVWANIAPELRELQKIAAKEANTPDYPFETPVVYNRTLDEITKNDQIKLIVIGDNPGKDEQLAKNNKYLVGQAGKIAQGYFAKNPELGIDFRKNAIILNKTPIHSAKTAQLKKIAKLGGQKITRLLDESQIWMAEKTGKLHIDLCRAGDDSFSTELWLVGYSELKTKGIFEKYRDELKALYQKTAPDYWKKVFVFQHFSMNRFTIDLKEHFDENLALIENIHDLGILHRSEIFGE